MDWSTIVRSAQTGFEKGVNDWILASRVRGGLIQGPNAELTPGSLSSDVNFEPAILQSMAAAGAPAQVGQIVARELWSAWKEWADGFRMSLPGAFPTFAALPGPQAPLTRSAQAGYSVALGMSAGEYRLQAATLQGRLATSLRIVAGREAMMLGNELARLATWVDTSFREWKAIAQVMGIAGQGTAPAYAPPYVPVAPVFGTLVSGGVIAGPKFGSFGF